MGVHFSEQRKMPLGFAYLQRSLVEVSAYPSAALENIQVCCEVTDHLGKEEWEWDAFTY